MQLKFLNKQVRKFYLVATLKEFQEIRFKSKIETAY